MSGACCVAPMGGEGMRPDRLRLRVMAAWLGVLALGLDALVPVHLAFDLAHAELPARHGEHASDLNFIAALLTLITGHRDAGGNAPDQDHHHSGCAVCGAAATLTGFAPAAVPLVAAPAYVRTTAPTQLTGATPRAAHLAAYRSRAPPVV